MLTISFLLVPMGVAALFISYQDWKEGLVQNKYVATLLAFGLVFQLLQGNLLQFPLQILKVVGLGALISFFLWWLGILPAGDSKLFTSLLLYFPLRYYSQSLILDFLINIFVPIFLFLFVYLLLKSGGDVVWKDLKNSFRPYRIGMLFLILVGFAWFVYAPLKLLGLDVGYFGLLILLFLGYELLLKISSGKTELAFVLLAISRIVIDWQNALTLNFFTNTLLIIFVFAIIRFFALSLSFRFYSKAVDVKNLRPGMSLAEKISKKGNSYIKKGSLKSSLVGYLMGRKENTLYEGSLGEGEVSKLRRLKERGRLHFKKVRIFRKQHFSTFVFAGYFLTFLMGTNFASFLASFI